MLLHSKAIYSIHYYNIKVNALFRQITPPVSVNFTQQQDAGDRKILLKEL